VTPQRRRPVLLRLIAAERAIRGAALVAAGAIATSLLVPLEVYELVRKPGPLKAAGIAVNLLIVLYLARRLHRRVRGA
jgi:uncharacterized membrane protein (DUF2068 family)